MKLQRPLCCTPTLLALKIRWHIFTDGAWEGEEDDADTRSGPPPPAGYGAVEIDAGGEHEAPNGAALQHFQHFQLSSLKSGQETSSTRGHTAGACQRSTVVSYGKEKEVWKGTGPTPTIAPRPTRPNETATNMATSRLSDCLIRPGAPRSVGAAHGVTSTSAASGAK